MCAFVHIHCVLVLLQKSVYVCLEVYICVFMGVFMMYVFVYACLCMRLLSGVCFVCVCVTDVIWCRLVSVLRLQAVSQRLIDKWIWFANVIKLIRKTAMGCWAQISRLQYLCFFLFFYLNIYLVNDFHDSYFFFLKLQSKLLKLLLMRGCNLRLVRKKTDFHQTPLLKSV